MLFLLPTLYVLYQFIIALRGLSSPPVPASSSTRHRFAILVPAHNEEAVIGKLVENLNSLDYPRELYDIYVIADNCTDATAEIARKLGAIVLERHDTKRRGKQYALRYALERIPLDYYDAVVVFDADNLVSRNFLKEMSYQLDRGAQAVQAYLDTKNPYDSWVTKALAVGYWISNRAFQYARTRWGLNVALGGTGMCITTKALKEVGWDPKTNTDDLELQVLLTKKGYKIAMAWHAVVYDEKPASLRIALKQRSRWWRGHIKLFLREFLPLLWNGIRRRNRSAIDTAIYLAYPVMLLYGLVILGWGLLVGLQSVSMVHVMAAYGLAVPLMITLPFQAVENGKRRHPAWVGYLILLGFVVAFASIKAVLELHKNDWERTPHTRGLDLTAVET